MLSHATSPDIPPFHRSRFLQVLLPGYALAWAWAAWKPLYPHDWMMENLLVLLFLPLLGFTHRRFRFSELSYLLLALFLALHAVGAHYTYANVPLGFSVKEAFGLARNPFDRAVHFAFGLLLAYPARELFLRVVGTRGFWNFVLPVDVVLSLSGLFEIFESWAARLTSPELGDAYLGTQGDVWDAQKDMTAAATGAVLAMAVTAAAKAWRGHRAATTSGNAR